MLILRALFLLSLCLVIPAQAGLLDDTEARKQIQKLEARIQKFEAQVLKLEDLLRLQTRSMLDLQSQIEEKNSAIRNLRGQTEEVAHGLQNADKRQKDFYVDLDTRLRQLEMATEKVAEAESPPDQNLISDDPFNPAPENRAYETAYGLFKSASYAEAALSFQDFLKKYPDSVYTPNAEFLLGNVYFEMKSYRSALDTYQALLKNFPSSRPSDVLYGVARSQQALKLTSSAQKTLKQIVAKYPSTAAAAKAKKQLASK